MTREELLAKKRHVLVSMEDTERVYSVIVEPKRISPCGKYIELGDYYSDEISGWVEVDDVARSVVSVIKEFEQEPEERRPFCFFSWLLGRRRPA